MTEEYNKFYVFKNSFSSCVNRRKWPWKRSWLTLNSVLVGSHLALMGWKASSSCPFGTSVQLCGREALHIASSAIFLRTEGTCESLALPLLIPSEGHLSSFHLFKRSQVKEATSVSEVIWTDLENRRSAEQSILGIRKGWKESNQVNSLFSTDLLDL